MTEIGIGVITSDDTSWRLRELAAMFPSRLREGAQRPWRTTGGGGR